MSSIVIAGDVSGSVTLQAPSAAGSTVLTLPSTSGTVITNTSGTASAATTATTATNLASGAQGSVPYQSASGTTAMLSAGTSGQVLTTQGAGANPTWTTPSAGATVLISSATASSSATVDMTLPSGYSAYQVIFYNVTNSVETRFEMAYTTNAFSTVSNWDNSVLFVWASNSSSSASDTTSGLIVLNRPTSSTYPASGSIIFPGASNSGYYKSYIGNVQSQLNTSPLYTGMCGGVNSSTSPINGIRFKFSSGNIVTGTFKLYGIT